jgi:hypothetical protein
MGAFNSMRRVWIGVALAVFVLAFHPAWTGSISWWLPGISLTIALVLLVEPLVLTWEVRRRGEELQITDEGIMRKLPRGGSEYVRWSELREVSIVVTPGGEYAEEYFYVLVGTGTSGVLVGQRLAARHDLVSHLAKLPGYNHSNIMSALGSPVNQRFVVWRAAALEGEATVLPADRIGGSPRFLEKGDSPSADAEKPRLH